MQQGLGRASPSTNERERCYGRERRRQGLGCAALPPPLYIGAMGGAGPSRSHLEGGGGQGGGLPPKPSGAPPPLGFPNPRRRGGPRGAHQPTWGWFPSH